MGKRLPVVIMTRTKNLLAQRLSLRFFDVWHCWHAAE